MGPEKIGKRFKTVNPELTFQSVTSSLEENYPGMPVAFCYVIPRLYLSVQLYLTSRSRVGGGDRCYCSVYFEIKL